MAHPGDIETAGRDYESIHPHKFSLEADILLESLEPRPSPTAIGSRDASSQTKIRVGTHPHPLADKLPKHLLSP